MKIKQITETSTTAGSIAPVQGVLGSTQTRGNPSIYGGKKVGNLFKGKTTSKPYANSLNEAAMKDLSYDLEVMKPAEFQKKYGKSREEVKAALSRQPKPAQPTTPPINEADLSEQDLIMVPGQGKKLKPGFISKADDRTDHEVEMARSDLFQSAKNAKKVYSMIKDVGEDEGLEGWVQEKIIKANDYLNTVREYLEGKQTQGVAEGAPELLKKEMPLHRHAEKLLAQNGVSKDDPDYHHHLNNTIKHLRQFGNIDLINKSDEQSVAEGEQRVDSLVTDALKVMRGSDFQIDPVKAIKTVLGDREYNSRRGFYSFYVKQLMDMYGQEGIAEGLGKDIKRLATGKDVKSRAGQEIAKSQDASMKGDNKTSKKHFDRYDKLDKLANKEQGVAEGEGNVAIGQQMANDGITYSPEKENELIGLMAQYMKKSGMSPKEIRHYLSYDEDYISDQLSYLPRKGQQGVAEGSGGNWYIRVNGKILNDTKFKPMIFSSEDEARSYAMKLADKKRIPLSQIKLTKSWMDAPEQGVAEGEGNKYGSQENWDSLRKDIRSQYPYKKGTNVTVPHKGKLVNGKIVRYEAGKGGYSPTYVVDIGEYESIMVPPNKVRRDATESLGTTGAMTNGEMGEGKRNLKCVCKTHGTLQCPVHTPKDIDVLEGAKVDRMVKHVAKSEKKLGHSKKEAENIAWATANKRGMLDNKNKKA